jgi:hypothetical protein
LLPFGILPFLNILWPVGTYISSVLVYCTKKSGNPVTYCWYLRFFEDWSRSYCDQGSQIFLNTINQNEVKFTKLPLYYQMTIKYNTRPYYIPNGYKIYKHFPFQDPPKTIPIVIFGLKMYHLATLFVTWMSQQCRWDSLSAKALDCATTYIHAYQGCQIFLGETYQNGEKYTKWP